jgi:hypothetical protein
VSLALYEIFDTFIYRPFHHQNILVEQVRKRAAQLNHYEAAVDAARRHSAAQYQNWKQQRPESNTNPSRLIPIIRSRERSKNTDLVGLYDTAGRRAGP